MIGAEAATAITAISTISSVAGVAAKAFGQYGQNQSAQRISEYNSKVAVQNAKLIMQSAELDLERGRKKKEWLVSKQRAAYAKAGVKSEGSPFEVMSDTLAEYELDLQIDYFNAQVAANSEIAQSRVDAATASMYKSLKIIQPVATISEGLGRIGYNVASLIPDRNPNLPGQVYSGGKVKTGDYLPYGG